VKTTRSKKEFASLPGDYAGLCRLLLPARFLTRWTLTTVAEITDAMAGHKLTADQEDYFDLLCRLIENYEKEHAQLTARESAAWTRFNTSWTHTT